MEQLSDELGLTRQEQLELIAVRAGLKPVFRLERPAYAGCTITARLSRLGFACVEGNFHLVFHHRHPLGDTFVRTAPGAAVGRQRGVYFVAPIPRAAEAEALARVEARTPGSPEIGHRLGYPPCCVAGYEEIHRGQDWIGVMLASTPAETRGLAACNRLARLFGEWSLLPDYYPCSFNCRESAVWSSEIAHAAAGEGLRSYVEAAKYVLELEIRVEEHTITLLDHTPQTIRHRSGIKFLRTLKWLKYHL